VLYTDPTVAFAGKIIGGIRVRAPKPGAKLPSHIIQAQQPETRLPPTFQMAADLAKAVAPRPPLSVRLGSRLSPDDFSGEAGDDIPW